MYYINPIWFYLIGLCDNIFIISMVALLITGIGISVYAIDAMYENREVIIPKKFIAILILSIILATFVPSSDTIKEMMIASVVTHENVDATIEDVKELIDYTIEKAGELNDN